ncbi:hypothetical protein GNP80_09835 [Aliivibrio fischeri]|nr:hypothetical protein [Aliivibrio fischeri]
MKTMRFFMLFSCFFLFRAEAQVVDFNLSIYSKGTMLSNTSRDKRAADYWHRLTNQIIASESKLGSQAMWQYAGLSEALAAIEANKYNDIKAYEYWANSTRYLLTGGTEWVQLQKALHRRYEQINTQLSTQLTTTDIGVSLDSEWQRELAILQVWEEKLQLFVFKGPKLGLKANNSTPKSLPVDVPNYYSSKSMKPVEKGKLTGLNRSFTPRQSFTPRTESAEIELTDIYPQDNPRKNKPEQIVIITPDEEFNYRNVEIKDLKSVEENQKEAPESEYNPIHKANIGNSGKSGVEVLQRRSFTPMMTEEENK